MSKSCCLEIIQIIHIDEIDIIIIIVDDRASHRVVVILEGRCRGNGGNADFFIPPPGINLIYLAAESRAGEPRPN